MVKLTFLSAYLELTKPKVTLLNLFVGFACFALAELPSINWPALAVYSVVGYLTVGGCGALNCYFDRDVDGLMDRTSHRAIPTGRITSIHAMAFGLVLTSLGIISTYLIFGALTTFLVCLGMIFYVFVYTLALKRRTRWNVVIGAVAGPFAALSGWTATGNALSLLPLLIALLDFLWTPGHLWALAIRRVKEYRRASIPMLPAASGLRNASKLVFLFNIAVFGFSLLPVALGVAGWIYLVIAVVAGVKLLFESQALLKAHSETQGSRLFLTSSPYLAVIIVAFIIDKIILLNSRIFTL